MTIVYYETKFSKNLKESGGVKPDLLIKKRGNTYVVNM